MPWVTEYQPDGAYVRFSGATTGSDIIRANTAFYAHAYSLGARFAVFDFAEVEELTFDRTDVERVVAQDVVAAAAALPDLVVAVVAPTLLSYGMARMWELQVDETGWRTRIARSRSEAMAWLADQGIETERFSTVEG